MTAVEDLLRELAPQVLGVLGRRYGDFDAAEDATQEALIAAAAHWAELPDNPRAWLIQTGSRKLLDHLRGESARRRREELAARLTAPVQAADEDDTLTVLLLSCHPALSPAAAVALALRAVGGLRTAEIAAAFGVAETTMAQRISRAKHRITASGVPFRRPADAELPERLRSVRHILYLIFNEGYAVSAGPVLHRADLCTEAIRLTRLAHRMLPDDAETAGLLALMLLTDARRPARTDPAGDLVPLAEQDRTRWNRPMIAEGTALLNSVFGLGEYRLQAAIAALHSRAAGPADTDWPQILALYGLLERLTGNPAVALSRTVAVAMVHGPEAGLALLDELAPGGGHRADAVRAHLLERAGDRQRAAEFYAAAAAGTTSLPERRYLTLRAARLR